MIKIRGAIVTRALLALLFVLAAGIGFSTKDRLRYPDEKEYHALAQGLLNGEGYVDIKTGDPTAFRPPGYPMALSIVYRVWNRPLAMKILHAVLLTLAVGLLSRLAGRILPESAPLVPLFALGLFPVALYTSSTLYPQTLSAFVLVATLTLIFSGVRGRSVWAGLLWGAGILVNPSFLLLLPVVALGLVFYHYPSGARAAWVKAALFAACAACVVVPWTIRNQVVMGGFVPVSTNSGINLLLGNSEHSGSNSGVNVDLSSYQVQTKAMGEVEKDRFFRSSAIAWVQSHPGDAAGLYLRKWLNHFNFKNKLATASEAGGGKDLVMFCTYYSLCLLVILRWVSTRFTPFSRIELALLLIYVGNAFASAVFFTRIRFRLPFDLLFLVPAAVLGALVLGWWKSRRTHRGLDRPA